MNISKSNRRRIYKNLAWLYPPLWGMSIKVVSIDQDIRDITIRMKVRWYNRNGPGSYFGGSLLSMTDPFYALMIHANLGEGYLVVDKRTEIDFLKSTKEPVHAHFKISAEDLSEIKAGVEKNGKYIKRYYLNVETGDGEVIAKVVKEVYIRRKNRQQ